MLKPIAAILLFLPGALSASQADAERIKREYELSEKTWILESKLATTAEERQAAEAERPNPKETAVKIFEEIAPVLKQDWTIPYAAFFLQITNGQTVLDANGTPQQAFAKDRDRMITFVKTHHLTKPGITPFLAALIDSGNSKALPILEEVSTKHPDEAIQGIAALGAAIILKNLGDDTEIMKQRLTYLRKAIIQSADQSIADRSVADIASDELYIIRYLTKGRTAPHIAATDVAGRTVKLSDHLDRIVVLLFWDAQSPQTDKIIQLTNQLTEKFRDRPVTVLGITPEDPEKIRSLQADGSILWNNIKDPTGSITQEYRVANRPIVYVLNGRGSIQYTGLPGSFVELTVDALLAEQKGEE